MAERNVFEIGRIDGDEDQLTEMLAWLVETVPPVGRALMALALADDAPIDPVTVETQQTIPRGRLDALLEAGGVALILESKLESKYGDDQLAKYARWLASERGDADRRVLLTLTKHKAPWDPAAIDLARDLDVQSVEKRWEDLCRQLNELDDDLSEIGEQLIEEFTEMLKQEGLVPMDPLNADELGDLWSKSRDAITALHLYFTGSIDTIESGLGASVRRGGSAKPDRIYRSFALGAISAVVDVGLWCTDADWTLPDDEEPREVPVLFAALLKPKSPGPEWDGTVRRLEAHAPDGWLVEPEGWDGVPCLWRRLDEVLTAGSIEAQQQALANACAQVLGWITGAMARSRDSATDTSGL